MRRNQPGVPPHPGLGAGLLQIVVGRVDRTLDELADDAEVSVPGQVAGVVDEARGGVTADGAGRPDLAWMAALVSSVGTRGVAAMVDEAQHKKPPWDRDFVQLLREAIAERLVLLEGHPRPTHRYVLTERGRQFVRQTATRGTVLP